MGGQRPTHHSLPPQVCTACTPNREYVRVFDVTERTALHRHQTGRACHKCGAPLRDTIVHFGERGTLGQPLNWEAATQAASKADTILCLGSSLKVHGRHCGWAGSGPAGRWPARHGAPAPYSLVPWCVCGPSVRPAPQVLKKYPRLWCMTKPPSRRPKLYIVNLQVTCCSEAHPSSLGRPVLHSCTSGGLAERTHAVGHWED